MIVEEVVNPGDLINKLRKEGIKLWEEEGKLKFKAPKGLLTKEKIELLKSHKKEVIDLLKAENHEVTVVPDPDNRYEYFPLTDVQAAYLLGRNNAFDYGGVACHLYLELEYDELDTARVETIWNDLIANHEMLRAEVSPDGHQRILQQAPHFLVDVHDLRNYTEDEAAKKLSKIRKEMANRVYQTDKWPLFGIGVSTTSKAALLHFSMEFLIADWASMLMIIREFESRYFKPENTIISSELSFRDYVIAERRLKGTLQYDKDKSYWSKRIPELPAAPILPKAKKEDTSSGLFERRELKLDLSSWNNLKNLAHQHGVTPTITVLSAYAQVLERWSGSSQFCLNLTVLNRLPIHKEVNAIIGDFTSVSMLEIDYSGEASFAEKARNINTRLFEDLDHRLFSGVEVIREVSRQHGKDRALMPIVFTSAIGLNDTDEGLKGRITKNGISQTPQVFLDCQAMDNHEGLYIYWDVRAGVFPENMIDDMFEVFKKLIFQLSKGNDLWKQPTTVSLPKRQENERTIINDTYKKLDTGLLHKPIVFNIHTYPDAIAAVDTTQTWTYKDLGLSATAVKNELEKLGFKQGERVAITIPKSVYQTSAVVGVLAAGGTYVPIDVTQPDDRRDKIINDATIKFLLTTTEADLSYPEDVQVIKVNALTAPDEINLENEYSKDKPAYIIYTSGSTGHPKGVVISHQAASNTIEDMNSRFNVTKDDAVLALAQLGFDLSVYDLFGVLGAGGKLIFPQTDRQTDPSHWVELMMHHNVTLWDTVPALMQMLVTYLDGENKVNMPSFRLALLSGDWIPLMLPDRLKQLLPQVQLISLGGATEASIWSIHHTYKGLQPDWTSIPYGRPLTNQGFRVLNKELKDCPEWVTGELYITGDGLATAYFNNAEMTQAHFFEHPKDGQRLYRTGDLGRYLPGGEIEFLGREDSQVKIRGHRIELGEIESALEKHDSVGNAKVVLDESNDQEKSLIAFVESAVNREGSKNQEKEVYEKLIAGIKEKSNVHVENLTHEIVEKAMTNLDDAVCYSMLRVLQNFNFFSSGKGSLDEIQSSDKILEKNRWLIRRWVELLVEKNMLEKQRDGKLKSLIDTSEQEENKYWESVSSSWTADLGTPKFIEYVRNNTNVLPELLNGTQDPVELLFPEGSNEYVEALYFKNPIVGYLNEAISTLVERLLEGKETQRPLRILEIGAGTGATTAKIVDRLKGRPIDYLYTDVVPAFVTSAKTKYGSSENMHFRVFDIDKDYRQQGLAPNSFDVIIAAGVLENARNIPNALQQVKELVNPSGWFIYTEPTLEHPWILASQAFMMQEPQDNIRKNSSYLDRKSWYDLTVKLGEGSVFHLPEPESHLSRLGVHLYATSLKSDKTKIEIEELSSFLQQKVPSFMIPSHLQLVDNIPLTNNGKVDVQKLKSWKLSIGSDSVSVKGKRSHYEDELEAELAEMWAEALGIASIEREQNFYENGADSLIMAQMAGKLRDYYSKDNAGDGIPFDTLLREMLNSPTIMDLASFIRTFQKIGASSLEGNNGTVQDNIGAYTNFGGGEEGPQRIIFPAALGTIDCFRPLIEELKEQQAGTIIGVSLADIDRYCNTDPSELIEVVAEDYAEHFIKSGYKQVQIVGYSIGCLTATEVARRLQENGIEIIDLILIDGHRIPFKVEDKLLLEVMFLPQMNVTAEQVGFGKIDEELFIKWLIQTLHEKNNFIPKATSTSIAGDKTLNEFGDVFRKMDSMSLSERFDLYQTAMPHKDGQKMPKEMMIRMFTTFLQSFQAASFEPMPYFGDIRYLEAEDDSRLLPGTSKGVIQFWSEICLGEFSLNTINGNHYTCLEPPFVKNVADILGEPLLAYSK